MNQEDNHELPANSKPNILEDDILEDTTGTVQPRASTRRKSNKSIRYLQQQLKTGSENDSSSVTGKEGRDEEEEAAPSSRRNSKIKMLLNQRRQSNNKRKSSHAIHTPEATSTTVNENDSLNTTTESTRKTNADSDAAFYNKSIVIRI